MNLSESQGAAMSMLRDGPVALGAGQKRTMLALERLGLVRYCATPELWKLTAAGRVWINNDDAERATSAYAEIACAAAERKELRRWRDEP